MQQRSNRIIKSRIIIAIILVLCSGQMQLTNAANYYVDPVNGDKADDGSKEAPWKTLAEVVSE